MTLVDENHNQDKILRICNYGVLSYYKLSILCDTMENFVMSTYDIFVGIRGKKRCLKMCKEEIQIVLEIILSLGKTLHVFFKK